MSCQFWQSAILSLRPFLSRRTLERSRDTFRTSPLIDMRSREWAVGENSEAHQTRHPEIFFPRTLDCISDPNSSSHPKTNAIMLLEESRQLMEKKYGFDSYYEDHSANTMAELMKHEMEFCFSFFSWKHSSKVLHWQKVIRVSLNFISQSSLCTSSMHGHSYHIHMYINQLFETLTWEGKRVLVSLRIYYLLTAPSSPLFISLSDFGQKKCRCSFWNGELPIHSNFHMSYSVFISCFNMNGSKQGLKMHWDLLKYTWLNFFYVKFFQ